MVTGRGDVADAAEHTLRLGQQLTFGRDRSVDIRFPAQGRLSRLAGLIRGVPDGVTITNLSASHGLHVQTERETMVLVATAEGRPVTSVLVSGGSATVTWPGAGEAAIGLAMRAVPGVGTSAVRTVTGEPTRYPLTLNELTKEFAVALFLCLPRLRAVPGRTTTPTVTDLTRQILSGTNSFHLLGRFDADRSERTKLTGRTHEHLKSLRDKIVQAGLAPPEGTLSPESVADLLVLHNVVGVRHVALLDDDDWLSRQEQNWER